MIQLTSEELEHDIITRVFDESFLTEKILTKLLHAYRDAAIEAEREACARVAETLVAKTGPKGVARAIRARH